MYIEVKYTYYYSNKLLMNNNIIISFKKKINLILPILLASALILGPIALVSDVFATTTPINCSGSLITANPGIAQANNATTTAQ
jgi:hypothetical protein